MAAIGVSVSVRGADGAIADEALTVICDMARQTARSMALGVVVITGNIHTANHPSESLVIRAGFEPLSTPNSEYQQWISRLVVH